MPKDLIKMYRKQLGYSQDYMGIKLDISQRAYSKIERGPTELSVKRLYQIAKILEVDISELLPPPPII